MADLSTEWAEHLQARDPEKLGELIADDVVVRLGVHDMPVRGGQLVRGLLHIFMRDLQDVRVVKELVDGRDAVVVFEGSVDGRPLTGVNLLAFDEDEKVSEVTIFLRPLGAVAVAAEVVMVHIAEQVMGAGQGA